MHELTTPIDRDVQIHIHEHVGPLRERVSKLEGRMDVHDRELTLLRTGLDNLRDRIDGVRIALIEALEKHTAKEDATQEMNVEKIDSLVASYQSLDAKIDGIKSWILAVGVGAGVVFGIFEFLVRSGIFHHG